MFGCYRRRDIVTCIHCENEKAEKVMMFGLPMKFCPKCKCLWGLGGLERWLWQWSGGVMMRYDCNYFFALWHWLTNDPHD